MVTNQLLVNFKVYANGRERAVSIDLVDGAAVAGVVGLGAAKSLTTVLAVPMDRLPLFTSGRNLSEQAFQPTLLFLWFAILCSVFDALLTYNIVYGAFVNM